MIERTRAALTLLDSKWSVPVIVLLASGVRRHARLMDNIPGISKKVLSATLRKLEHHGLAARDVYAEIPVRVEYRLTPLGWQLTEPLMAFDEWARQHQMELAHPFDSDHGSQNAVLPPRPRNGRRFGHENGDLPGGLLPPTSAATVVHS